MRHLISVFALSMLVTISSLAQHSPRVDLKVDEAVVFMHGALVTHKASFDLKPGENELRITGLPTSIDPNSVQLGGGGDYEITGMRHEINFAGGGLNPLGRAKRDSLDNARFSLKTKQAVRAAFTEELLMLQANRNVGGKNNVLLAEDLEEMADFFRERVKQINYKTLEITEEERELNTLIQRLENELRDLRAIGNKNTREVIVKVNGRKSVRAELTVSYFAHEARWEVFYDVRSAGTGAELELISKARVNQFTGVDWSGVTLALATGSPSVGGSTPVLQPWRVYAQEPIVQSQTRTSGNESDLRDGRPSAKASYDMEEMVFDQMVVSENRQQLNTVYKISTPYTISGDNRSHEVEIRRITVPATYRHRAVPKLTNDVFMTAEITDLDQYNLLTGEASVYFEGSFVGKTLLNPRIASDTLSLSLGRDKSITIEYEQVKDFSRTTSIGSKRRTTRGYRIRVMNTGTREINLRIEDQIPLSTANDIEIEAEELSGGKLDPVSGLVTWDLNLMPGRMSEKLLRFQVRYPKKKVINGL